MLTRNKPEGRAGMLAIRLCFYAMWLYLLAHVLACIWWFIAELEDNRYETWDEAVDRVIDMHEQNYITNNNTLQPYVLLKLQSYRLFHQKNFKWLQYRNGAFLTLCWHSQNAFEWWQFNWNL